MKRIDFRDSEPRSDSETRKFSLILKQLKEQSGCALYDDDFEKWLWDNCGIRQLHENEQFPTHLTGLEMSEEAYTMLLLRANV